MIYFFVFLFSLSLVGLLTRWVKKAPNNRSSHVVPTSCIGGIGVVASLILGLFPHGLLEEHGPLLGVCSLFGILGFIDDLKPISALKRLGIQLFLSFIFLCAFHGHDIFVSATSLIASLVFITWVTFFVNTTNFMDGLNGLTAMTMCVFAFYYLFTSLSIYHPVFMTLIAALLGFFVWNALGKIFMGDSGSYFLGAFFAILPFYYPHETGVFALEHVLSFKAWTWVAGLYGLYLFDVTITLIKRMIQGKNILHPHREYLFHLLHLSGYSHLRVSALYAGIQSVMAVLLYFVGPAIWLYALWALALTLWAIWIYGRAKKTGVLS